MTTPFAQIAFPALDDAIVRTFAQKLHGRLLHPGVEGYDAARAVFNAMIDRCPALIVRPTNAEDVRRAVWFAREHGLALSVKGGGHNVAGTAVCDGGLMLDLSAMRGVSLEPARQVALAEPGLLLGELDHATQAHGLATPLGVVSLTGIAGLTLGGGLGWLNGKHGLTCDNLLAAEVVTADGDIVTASADQHPDLFWAIRGGSGNFGVVTSFTYRLHHVGPVLGGSLAFPPERAREVLRTYHAFASTCPDELSTTAGLSVDAAGRPTVGIGVCWSGPLADGEEVLRPLRALKPVEDSIAPMAYEALQTAGDAGFPSGRQHYWKASWLTDLSEGAIDVLLHFAAERPSPATVIGLQQMHGAAARADPAATAFPHRRSQYDLLILSQWGHAEEAEQNISWTRAFFDAMRPYTERAVYVNDLGDEGADRVREAYGTNYERLAAIKAAYDQTNFFRTNQNIRPSA